MVVTNFDVVAVGVAAVAIFRCDMTRARPIENYVTVAAARAMRSTFPPGSQAQPEEEACMHDHDTSVPACLTSLIPRLYFSSGRGKNLKTRLTFDTITSDPLINDHVCTIDSSRYSIYKKKSNSNKSQESFLDETSTCRDGVLINFKVV